MYSGQTNNPCRPPASPRPAGGRGVACRANITTRRLGMSSRHGRCMPSARTLNAIRLSLLLRLRRHLFNVHATICCRLASLATVVPILLGTGSMSGGEQFTSFDNNCCLFYLLAESPNREPV